MSDQDRVQSYASAFLEASLERWLAALDAVAHSLAENRQLQERLEATDVEFGERQLYLDRLLPSDVDIAVRNLCYTLLKYGDLGLISGLSAALRQRIVSAETQPTEVDVVSAVSLTEDERSRLVARLEAQYGSGLDVRYRVDATILGGLIVRVGDKLIDGSLSTRFSAMQRSLGVVGKE